MPHEVPIPEMTPVELVAAIEADHGVHVLDIRAPNRLESGKIDIVAPEHFHNVELSRLLALENLDEVGVERGAKVAVVCSRGNDSKQITRYLNDHGYHAASVHGGMIAWMEAMLPRYLATPPELDRFVQFDRVGKGALCYLLASDGEVLIVDPPRHTVTLIEMVDAAGWNVVGVLDTHAHADYLSGGPVLALALDAPYWLHPKDAVSPYDGARGKVSFSPLEDGQTLSCGRAELTVLSTPGHTEGSVTLRLGDAFALTGDFLFVKSVGRPDLGDRSDEWTPRLWQSLERARRDWPDDLVVYPAHYNASAGERRDDNTIGARFGDLKRINKPLAMATGEEFAAWVRAKQRPFPESYRQIKAVNIGLETIDDVTAEELEAGRNVCALD